MFKISENDIGQYPNKNEQKHFITPNLFQDVSNVNTTGRDFLPHNCFSLQFKGYAYLAVSVLEINQSRILTAVHVYPFMG